MDKKQINLIEQLIKLTKADKVEWKVRSSGAYELSSGSNTVILDSISDEEYEFKLVNEDDNEVFCTTVEEKQKEFSKLNELYGMIKAALTAQSIDDFLSELDIEDDESNANKDI